MTEILLAHDLTLRDAFFLILDTNPVLAQLPETSGKHPVDFRKPCTVWSFHQETHNRG
jgi:hypothetical protein